tara:strand:+ start:392 stop:1033 length:642 start_codon:yes stop_codon:yes gene_type:complete
MQDNKSKYWDNYYGNIKDVDNDDMPPSQFAAFCRTEVIQLKINQIIEIASGDGRDCIFFADQGLQVLATDNSTNAVELLKNKASLRENLSVAKVDAVSESLPEAFFSDQACAYYARFFIHTLEEEKLKEFFKNIAKVMRESDYLFLEYRNLMDENLEKVMPKHFRKFFETEFVTSVAKENGLKCNYQVEGRGFAKWKADDAFVTRQIFVKQAR